MLSSDKYLKTSKLLLVICLFLFKNNTSQNLIQNPSFEYYTNTLNCSGNFDNYNATPVYHVLDNWYTLNSSDYFNNTCHNNGWYSTPDAFFGDIFPKQGDALIGIGVYDMRNDYNEYIYQTLTSPLQAGKIYCLSFFVSRADRFPFAIKNIGAYFSATTPTLVNNYYVNAMPQVENQNGFIVDTVNWVEVQGCFIAAGGEQCITIGNFNNNPNTDTLRIQSSNALTGTGTDVSYYYIDDITLIDQTTVGINELSNGASVSVYPNPANDVLNINLSAIKENVIIKITDVIGRDVLNTEYKSQLDISFLEKGIYFISIHQDGKTLGVKKIVKE